jgi:glyoxylase-like metal-dependent hydrolase (beta-lactamase superfamily II)
MELGDLKLTLVNDGEFRLDGGAMFGVVPRTMWEREKPPDELNRIRMGTNCLLVERGRDLLLIDTGIGDKHDPRFQGLYGMDPQATRLPEAIRRAGYELGDVNHVLLSHLHFDHCGWNTREDGGKIVPTFPKATYWLQRGEVDHARLPNERDRASYFPENWEPLFEAGAAELFGDEAEPIPGVKAVRVPGHNADMCIVLLDGGEDARAVYWADLVPTAAHVPYPWIMGYDLYPLTTLDNKKLWLPKAAAGDWLCIFEHDPVTPLGRLVEEKPGRFRAVPVQVPEDQPVRT